MTPADRKTLIDAARELDAEAEILRQSHCKRGTRTSPDWPSNDPTAKATYFRFCRLVARLRAMAGPAKKRKGSKG